MSIESPPTASANPLKHAHLWEIAAFRDLMGFGLAAFFLWIGYHLRGIVVPVLIGLGLAYLISPALEFAEHKWKFPRWLAVAMMVILIGALVTGLGLWIGPILTDQIRHLSEKGPTYLAVMADRYAIQVDEFTQSMNEFSENAQKHPLSTIQKLVSGTGQVFTVTNAIIGTFGAFLFSLSLVMIYFVFFAWYFPSIQRSLWQMVESMDKPELSDMLCQMDQAVGDFFRGRMLIALIMSVMFGIGWLLVDVPYWGLLGFGAGLLSLIPYAATLIWPIAILLKYLDMSTGSQIMNDFWMQLLFWPSAVYLLIQFIEGWILTPWIQSQATDLNAATILLVVLVGGAIGGVLGMILAIPFTACLHIMAKELLLPRLRALGTGRSFAGTSHSNSALLKKQGCQTK
jgi:predicted PurR-regulated permease PerM